MLICKHINISEAIKKCFWALYVFVLFFSPPLIPYPHLFLAVASGIVLLMQRTETTLRIARQSGLLQWLTSMALFAIYVLCVPLFVSAILGDIVNFAHYCSVFNRYAMLIVCITPCSILLIKSLKKYSYEYFIEVMIYAGLMEGVCSALAYLFPTVKQAFLFLMGRYSDIYDNGYYTTVRAFGFAGMLLDLFGLGIALIAGVCFYYGINFKKKRIYILFSFMIALSALLNARTGVILFAVGVAFTVYDTICSRRVDNIFTILLLFITVPCVVAFILNHVEINNASSTWLQSGLGSFIGFLQTGDMDVLKQDASADHLFSSQFWRLPDFPRLLIGTGHTLYQAKGYRHSDVGYVNDLWLGGIVAYIMLYKDIFLLGFRLMVQKQNRVMRFVGCYCIICYLIFNIKANALGYNPGGAALFLLLFVSTYYARRPKYDNSQLYYTRL